MSSTVEWFFGRGISIGCGLTWTVPQDWHSYAREEQIQRIKTALTLEMEKITETDTKDIRSFLDQLSAHTTNSWMHRFHTTNWDFLLQREIQRLKLKSRPAWLAGSHVYHLNGTIEVLPENIHRSEIVLESDTAKARTATTEGNSAFNRFVWSRIFVVVGMSFECEVDKYLLSSIEKIQDDLPIGCSRWIVLNPDAKALASACERLSRVLPMAKVEGRLETFREWLDLQMPELHAYGALI